MQKAIQTALERTKIEFSCSEFRGGRANVNSDAISEAEDACDTLDFVTLT
jgi:hypothetical protein